MDLLLLLLLLLLSSTTSLANKYFSLSLFIQVWRNDMFMKSMQMHKGAVFAIAKEGKWLFTGGWDKTVNIQVHVQNVVFSSLEIY